MELNPTFRHLLPHADAAAGQPLSPRPEAVLEAKLEEAAEGFEAFFVTEMLRQMHRATQALAGEDSVFSNRINQDMLDMANGFFADTLAGQRAFGVADAIIAQLRPASASVPMVANGTTEPPAAGAAPGDGAAATPGGI